MDWESLVKLGALGAVAVLMILKDAKRDEWMQRLFEKLNDSLKQNTAAFDRLRQTIERNEK